MRVRWAEADMQGVVFNGHYLTYADICITEYWRAVGVAYPKDLHAAGCDTFVRKATVDYLDGARFDDELVIRGRTTAIGRSSMRFLVEIVRVGASDAPLTRIELVYVNASLSARQSAPWPPTVRERILAFEPIAPEDTR